MSADHDQFMNVASPGYTSETPEGSGGVWWALRLNDMDEDCAVVVALLHHEMNTAWGEVRSCRYNREDALRFPKKVDPRSSHGQDYILKTAEEMRLTLLELDFRATVAQTKYDYMRELLEAAYVC